MTEKPIEIRAALPDLRDRNGDVYSPKAYAGMVEQINEKAKDGRLLGEIDPQYNDGKVRLANVSHKVLPGAKLNDDGSISVTIQALDTPRGRQLKAMLEHSPKKVIISSRGLLKGVGSSPEDVRVSGIDLDISFPGDWTVLDGIVDALEEDSDES